MSKNTDLKDVNGGDEAGASGPGEAELLLKAGAVLPPGTPGAGPTAVDLTARGYRHPALGEDRVVVRLTPAELGAAEDLAAGFLGLVPEEGEPPVVGLSRRQALGFPNGSSYTTPRTATTPSPSSPNSTASRRRPRPSPRPRSTPATNWPGGSPHPSRTSCPSSTSRPHGSSSPSRTPRTPPSCSAAPAPPRPSTG